MDVPWTSMLKSGTLLFVLLNPFLMSVYLLDLIEQLDGRTFTRTLARGTIIATTVFCVFAVGGDAIFSNVLHVRFASFLIFGGVLFSIIGIRFAQLGSGALSELRGAPEHIAGSIAMPFMVGPATVSASILAGADLPIAWALISIVGAMTMVVAGLAALKYIHEHVKARNAALVDRYVDIVGRASALLIGTFAVEMILKGFDLWLTDLGPLG